MIKGKLSRIGIELRFTCSIVKYYRDRNKLKTRNGEWQVMTNTAQTLNSLFLLIRFKRFGLTRRP